MLDETDWRSADSYTVLSGASNILRIVARSFSRRRDTGGTTISGSVNLMFQVCFAFPNTENPHPRTCQANTLRSKMIGWSTCRSTATSVMSGLCKTSPHSPMRRFVVASRVPRPRPEYPLAVCVIDDPELVAASSGLITFDASSWTMDDHLISFVTLFVILYIPNPIT